MHTVDAKEIEIFAKDSSDWLDEAGPFRPLHRLNPVRLSYIKEQICAQYALDTNSLKPFKGLSVLDIGCGGGLVCEPMARLGADVTGIDADSNAIAVAKNHAAQSGLEIDYRPASTDGLIASDKRYDVVLALEIVEHVADVERFVEHALSLCKPSGLVIFSPLNRTPKSFLLGKLAAEYILGWVPKGTHDWKKFLKPSELASAIRQAGGETLNLEGMVFNPIKGDFERAARDVDVNYFLSARPAR
jgi:2-polyprenyl-6-hydroxyphenyl methylase/3-demethylubiquinone-9 3-methyltransferase